MELSLCMIVKNEADVLERAVENARVFADEIVVVDTGSTDGTKAIAKRVADKTGEFKWRDDFAAARNYADSLATCPYKMWLDADDVVPLPSAKAIGKLMRTLDPATDVVMLPYVLARDEFGAPKFSYYRERIVRNRDDFMWRGRVHEAIAIHGNIIKAKPIILHAKPTGRASGTRNLDIYRKMAAEGHVFEPRETYYYARELYYNGEHDGARVRKVLGHARGVRRQRYRRVPDAVALLRQARRQTKIVRGVVRQLRVRAAHGRGVLRDSVQAFRGRRLQARRVLVQARRASQARYRLGRVYRLRLLRIFAVYLAVGVLRQAGQPSHGVLLASPRAQGQSESSERHCKPSLFRKHRILTSGGNYVF